MVMHPSLQSLQSDDNLLSCRRAKYDFFPSMFNTGDLTWYPPDYRRAVVDEAGGGSRCD